MIDEQIITDDITKLEAECKKMTEEAQVINQQLKTLHDKIAQLEATNTAYRNQIIALNRIIAKGKDAEEDAEQDDNV